MGRRTINVMNYKPLLHITSLWWSSLASKVHAVTVNYAKHTFGVQLWWACQLCHTSCIVFVLCVCLIKTYRPLFKQPIRNQKRFIIFLALFATLSKYLSSLSHLSLHPLSLSIPIHVRPSLPPYLPFSTIFRPKSEKITVITLLSKP